MDTALDERESHGGGQEGEEARPPAKKRRIPKACFACRRSKVRCDESRPCQRCVSAGIECIFYVPPKDATTTRLDSLEGEIRNIQDYLAHGRSVWAQLPSPAGTYGMNSSGGVASHDAPSSAAVQKQLSIDNDAAPRLVEWELRQPVLEDMVTRQCIGLDEAREYFGAFFKGCHRFVPILDPSKDRFEQLQVTSAALFDVIIVYGCRAVHGYNSRAFQGLYPQLRRRTSDLLHALSASGHRASVDDIRAVLIVASYSEGGSVICDVAVQAAITAGLPKSLDDYLLQCSYRAAATNAAPRDERPLLVYCRTWLYVYVLDSIFSLEGGKYPAVSTKSSPRRARALLSDSNATAQDIRLLAQVELNCLRASSHMEILSLPLIPFDESAEQRIQSHILGHVVDLDTWLSDWRSIIRADTRWVDEHTTLEQNVEVQYAWAVLAVHLHALTATHVDNIAWMLPNQRNLASRAKSAAQKHLHLMLRGGSYIAQFKNAMDYVWAKSVFCVLIVLRLSILLGDDVSTVNERLHDGREFLQQLVSNGHGNAVYCRILSQIVEKCSRALVELRQTPDPSRAKDAGGDFQAFKPKEFMFDWEFPGLDLCHVPLDWQDLLIDFDPLNQT